MTTFQRICYLQNEVKIFAQDIYGQIWKERAEKMIKQKISPMARYDTTKTWLFSMPCDPIGR